MNENIDLIEILKDCPKGTKLYSRAIGTVTFNCIKSDRICVKNYKGIETAYSKGGKFCYSDEDAEIDLFPSKDQMDWSKWHRPFVDGDVVTYENQIAIFKKYISEDSGLAECYVFLDNNLEMDIDDGNYYVKDFATEEEKATLFRVIKDKGYEWDPEKKELKTLQLFKDGDIVATNDGKYIAIIENNGGKYYVCCHPNVNYFNIDGSGWFDRLATEEEKATLFDVIKSHGYKWNATTKTLEKLIEPKFKVGDKIKQIKTDNIYEIIKIIPKSPYFYITNYLGSDIMIPFNKQDEYELVPDKIEPKFKVGDTIRSKNGLQAYKITNVTPEYYSTKVPDHACAGLLPVKDQDNWILVPNKFDPKTLQPFDKVLVSCNDEWFCDFFSHYDDAVVKFNCICTGGCPYDYCIPYNDDTKHLIGKTIEDTPEFYRYWEHK